ncbi:DUF488 domain-containing protein [Luteolibacter arcticus]|uniref:DUF488 domain-containing protein n=1 Tax=Luteolibacter arcticus TaxID=1581411 RepID=A0ABT3GSR4_9BACT|nr:DUF488 domain-containing protein [Luteolibacter arcticus]MCW1926531.1 DUF488 domain-containing protein [Luteolibacter arcticus]
MSFFSGFSGLGVVGRMAYLEAVLFQRQKVLLGLLSALGGEATAIDFQKLLFLFCREEEEEPSYEFVPHRYGCYSFTSVADRRKLQEKGWLEACEKTWRLAKPVSGLPHELNLRLHRFAKRNTGLRGDDLVRDTYNRYPQTAWRSEIKERVLGSQPDALRAIDDRRPSPGVAGLGTIGYEGKSLEAYLNALLNDGVTILCDVRRNPLSRKYGFSKTSLRTAVEALGLRYEHLPELGIASGERQELKTQADYDALFDRYEARELPKQGNAVSEIAGWIRQGERVALTCYELHPQQCHRHCVAEAVERELGPAFSARHL